MGRHNYIFGAVAVIAALLVGWAYSSFGKLDDRIVATMTKMAETQTNVSNHEKLIDKLDKALAESRQTVAAVTSQAIRTCGDFTTYGIVVQISAEGFVLNAQGFIWNFAWKDSTIIADQQGNTKSRSDVKANTFVSVCFDNDNGVHRVVKLNILPDSPPQSAQPPFGPPGAPMPMHPPGPAPKGA